MRKTVTIPAAGEAQSVDITGRSLIIESSGVYQTVEDVPLFNFVPGGNQNPIYPRSTFFNVDAEDNIFNQIEIIGTAESAADEVTFYSTMACLRPELNINVGQTKKAIAGQTFSKTSTDAAQALSELELTRNGLLPKSIYISARTNNINWGFVDGGSSPDQNDNWHVLLTDAEPIEIQGIDFILKFQFASQAAGTAGELIVSPEY